ncbi:hypothetical protein NIES4071_67670 [Calothrix sp. NIES-4071]|nr:hypothetical protein NIES4071_67670 [Calothrix sp. NIES-4071]BAZ61045.1 hypothetical protein NIES4105_67630 [Calothrix sp. NIES-4105]
MLTSKIPNRVEIIKQKFTQSVGLPFRELLPQSVIQQTIDELKIKYSRRIFDVKLCHREYSPWQDFTQ